MMRVVVTGSGGRVGRAIVHRLVALGHEVVGVDRLPASTAVRHVGDVADPDVLDAACCGAEAIIHVAALHAPHVAVVPDAEHERINVGGTEAVIAAARRAGIRRVVFTSSTAVYGVVGGDRPSVWIDEDRAPTPRTIYHRTKLVAERRLREAATAGELEVRILRMSRCFPEPADLMAVYRLHRGIDARDVAAAHAAALTHVGGPHHTWIISGATPFVGADLDALSSDAPAVLRSRAPGLVAAFAARGWRLPAAIDRVYDPGRAARELGWRPRHGFASVLAMLDEEHGEVLPASSYAAPSRA
jgi:nucleoside-diphosphate-sugar epimerase